VTLALTVAAVLLAGTAAFAALAGGQSGPQAEALPEITTFRAAEETPATGYVPTMSVSPTRTPTKPKVQPAPRPGAPSSSGDGGTSSSSSSRESDRKPSGDSREARRKAKAKDKGDGDSRPAEGNHDSNGENDDHEVVVPPVEEED
jgi:hypothetical protein